MSVLPTQRFWLPDRVPAEGGAVTVTVRVAVTFEHPPVPWTVYVMVAVPVETPVTSPDAESTEATERSFDTQVPPGDEDVNMVILPIQTICVPDRVPAEGGVVTVTIRVDVAFGQPPVPWTVYVMVDIPAAIPVTRPVVGSTVATCVLSEFQSPPVSVEE